MIVHLSLDRESTRACGDILVHCHRNSDRITSRLRLCDCCASASKEFRVRLAIEQQIAQLAQGDPPIQLLGSIEKVSCSVVAKSAPFTTMSPDWKAVVSPVSYVHETPQLAGGGGIDRSQGRKAFRGKRSVVARPVRPALGVRGGSDRRGAGEGRNQQCVAKAHDAHLEVPAAPTAATTKSVRTDPRFDPHAGRCPAALNRDLVAVGIAVDGPGAALAERLGGRQRVFHELQVDAFAVDHAGID
jgi:hypothetical protein